MIDELREYLGNKARTWEKICKDFNVQKSEQDSVFNKIEDSGLFDIQKISLNRIIVSNKTKPISKKKSAIIDNSQTIIGNGNNAINQSLLESSLNNNIKQTIAPTAKERRQNPTKLKIPKFVWMILITVIGGVIILIIERCFFNN